MMKKNFKENGYDFGKLPPHDEKTESFIIGAILLESAAINEVIDILSPDSFYNEQFRDIYKAAQSLYNEGKNIDLSLISQRMLSLGMQPDFYQLSQLTSVIGSTTNIRDWALYVNQLYISREFITSSFNSIGKAYDDSNDIYDVITDMSKDIDRINNISTNSDNIKSIAELSKETLSNYNKIVESALNGISLNINTGLESLDNCIHGFKGGDMVIIGARPSMGKTALLLNFAKHAAITNFNVLIFSLEMSGISLANRLLMSMTDINPDNFKRGQLSSTEEQTMQTAVNSMSYLSITVDESPSLTIQQIRSRARSLKNKGKCDIIFIDYLQLIDMRSDRSNVNREQEVSQTSRMLKMIAKELNVPVVVLSQLSRKLEERKDKMPVLSDLRESGSIEQDADIVLFLHRPEYYDNMAPKGVGEIRISKQREGLTGDIKFAYNTAMTKIYDLKDKPF